MSNIKLNRTIKAGEMGYWGDGVLGRVILHGCMDVWMLEWLIGTWFDKSNRETSTID